MLKVAHHGSRTATSEAWLDALRPRVALVSAGTGNPYGHPAPETIERLRAHGARVLRTDLDGDLQVSTDGHDLRVATSGGRARGSATSARSARASPTTPRSRRVSAPGSSVLAPSPFLCAIPLSAARLAALPTDLGRAPAHGDVRAAGSTTRPTRARSDGPARASGPSLATIDSTMVPSHAAAAALFLSLSPQAWLADTPRPSRTSRHSSPSPRFARATRSTARWWRRQHCCTTWTRRSLAMIRCAPSGHGHAGAQVAHRARLRGAGPAVDSHPVGRLNDDPYEDWVRATTSSSASWPTPTSAPSSAS